MYASSGSKSTPALELETQLQRFQEQRTVRALGQLGSYGTAQAWFGSRPLIWVAERKREHAELQVQAEVSYLRWPMSALEQAIKQPERLSLTEVATLAELRISYDPSQTVQRLQAQLPMLWTHVIKRSRAEMRIAWQQRYQHVAQKPAIRALQEVVWARDFAQRWCYPLILAQQQQSVHSVSRYPEYIQHLLSLSQPKAVHLLHTLYGFAGADQAKALLLASRGLGLGAAEKQAQLAFQHGYYHGVVYLLRTATAQHYAEHLVNWNHFGNYKREKLSALLGFEQCPLGEAMLEQLIPWVKMLSDWPHE